MKVLFRTDASIRLGSGHLMRCMTLAQKLRTKGCQIAFVCRDLPDNLQLLLEQEEYSLWTLSAESWSASRGWQDDAAGTVRYIKQGGTRADWIVVDQYDLDARWEMLLREHADKIMVIDDLADREHECDLLLDQNLHDGSPYRERVPTGTDVLMGPQYALLRDEFRQARDRVEPRTGVVRRMVICFGSTDPTGETSKALAAVGQLNLRLIDIDVIVGASNPQAREIAKMCAGVPYLHFHVQVSDMANFLARADLALGGAGVSTWERLALGVPSLVVAVADNQAENMRQLQRLGLAKQLGMSNEVSVSDIAGGIQGMLSSPNELKDMSQRAYNFVDGKGTSRVVNRLMMVVKA